ncbi:MAG: GGDEF domain-containing protein [Lacrimispora celerecrescens]|uniref:GGDEF domain-containing protein n=1 Tax=Lacrimispora indolis TaxID=69825 RepID=UPI0009FC028E|nr:GGDEF domain-containing protein [[Clostridium] methoxybenzovorans]MBE7718888.1 GGDEF domain-containing protein [Lacrimispora celerecrescens]
MDYFKKINDTYGHSAGDSVLKDLSKELESYMRKGKDWVARFGGEEFFICLTNCDLDAAKQVAERIRSGIEKKEFTAEDQKIRLTCSFGIHAVCKDNQCTTVDGVIRLVDKHLYKAKDLGRNRIE